MKTDELIDALARDPAPAPVRPLSWRILLSLGAGLAIAATIVAVGPGVRDDIVGAGRMPVMMKAMFSAAAAGAALPMLLRLARPGRPLGWRVAAALGFLALAVAVGIVAMLGGDPAQRLQLWVGGAVPWCLAVIPLLAAPVAALLAFVLRDLAPTRLASAGAALGAVSGGIGAMAYAMYCPVDSMVFVTVWYSLAIAICAAVGALLGSRLLRW
jgi:hypothetical protein